MLNNDALDVLRKALDALSGLDVKERRVRTQSGVEKYGQPIGAVIVADGISGGVPADVAVEIPDGEDEGIDFPDPRIADILSRAKQLQDEGQGEPVSDPPADPEDEGYEEPTYSRHDDLTGELPYAESDFVAEWVADFDSVKQFREEAQRILNGEEPDSKYYGRAAMAGLGMVENSPITDKPLYRGMRLPDDQAESLKVGDDYYITFGAFTTARNEARQYMDRAIEGGGGKKVEFELEPGARAIPMVGFQPSAIIGEHVTSGKFEIVGVTEEGDVTRVKIRHISTLEPGDLAKKESDLPNFVEGDFDLPRRSGSFDKDNPPQYLYRAVSEEDWAGIQERGYIQSDGRMNLAEYEGTVAADSDPSFYLPTGVNARGRIIRITYDEQDGWYKDIDGYWKTNSRIPVSRVDAVTGTYVDQTKPDEYRLDRFRLTLENTISNALNSIPGWDGYGVIARFRDRVRSAEREVPREGATKDDLDKFVNRVALYLRGTEQDVDDNAYKYEREYYDALVEKITPIIEQARAALESDDLFLMEPGIEEDGQYVLPGMPERPARDLIGIIKPGGQGDLDASAFDLTIRPHTPIPISVKRAPLREDMPEAAVEIKEIEVIKDKSEQDMYGWAFRDAIERYEGVWINPERDNMAAQVKIAVNEQITRRIADHAAANPDFQAWLDDFDYENVFYKNVNGAPIFRESLGIDIYAEEIDKETYARESYPTKPSAIYFTENDKYYRLDLDRVPEDVKKRAVKTAWMMTILAGSIDERTGEAFNIRNTDRVIEEADKYSYSEVVIRLLTRMAIDQWAATSADSDKESIRLQLAAMDRFGLESETSTDHFGLSEVYLRRREPDEMLVFRQVLIDAIYENTQEFFRSNGIKYVDAYRGVKWDLAGGGDSIPSWAVKGNQDVSELASDFIEESQDRYVETYIEENKTADLVEEELRDRFDEYRNNNPEDFYADAPFDLEDLLEDSRRGTWKEEYDDYAESKYQDWFEENFDEVDEEIDTKLREDAMSQYYDWGVESEILSEFINDELYRYKPAGTMVTVDSQPLSSWSVSTSTAEDFGSSEGAYGLVLSGRIPVERIFCTTITGLGCLKEGEIVVIGGTDEVLVES